jgi:phospholipid/cholesterol/gamma-HCH transport system substrate-binding protein
MTNRTVEVTVGIFIALGLAALFVLAMKVSNISTLTQSDGYTIKAKFDNIGGLKVRAPVTMAGVRIGRVTEIGFDARTFEAIVTVTIHSEFNQLPADTSASVYTAGLLGEQYLGLEPGADENLLENGSEIELTQSALVLEQVIGQFLYSKASEGN